MAVVVSVKIGKILNKLDASLPKNSQRNARVDTLILAAKISASGSRRSRQRIGELQAILFCRLAVRERLEPSKMLGKVSWTACDVGSVALSEIVDAER